MSLKFKVELAGSFHTADLYDDRGHNVFELNEAACVAEDTYGDDWQSVFNGNESLDRDDWLVLCEYDNLSDRIQCLLNEAKDDHLTVREAAVFVAESILDEYDCEVSGA